MATTTYPQDTPAHSYPPLSQDIDRSDTNTSFSSSFAKNRYPLDDDNVNDTAEPHPFPKDVAPQWDQSPPPPFEPPARKWWQGVRINYPSSALSTC